MSFSINVQFPNGLRGQSYDNLPGLIIKDSSGNPVIGAMIFSEKTDGWLWGIIRLTNGLISPTNNQVNSSVGIVSIEKIDFMWKDIVFHTESKVYMRPRGILEIPFAFRCEDNYGRENPLDKCLTKTRIKKLDNYGPTNYKQPTVDTVQQNKVIKQALTEIDKAIHAPGYVYNNEAENLSYQFKKLGPFTVEGYPNGYAHGGYGIDPNHGYEGVPSMLKYHFEMARANMHRQFCDAISIDTFEPVSLYEWKTPVGRDLMKGQEGRQNEIELLPFLVGDYNTYQYKVHSKFNVEPDYVKELWEYRPNDLAHIIRVVRHLIPLVEYLPTTNPIRRCALYDLRMIAEDCRYQAWSDRRDELATPAYPGQWIPQTLTRMMIEPAFKGHPRLERNAGWMAYLGACMIKYQGPLGWGTWADNMLDVFQKYQDEYSIPHRDTHPTAFPEGARGTQIFHMAILGIGATALSVQKQMKGYDWIERMATSIYLRQSPLKDPYGGSTYGPPHWWQTEQNGKTIIPPSFSMHGDPAHTLAFMALIIKYTKTPTVAVEFLRKSLIFYTPSNNLTERLALFQKMQNKSWIAHMQSEIEQRSTSPRR
jgi:hypothetical protein